MAGPPMLSDFPEEAYLREFPDIRTAVAQGSFASGLEHYVLYGAAEIGAGLRPWSQAPLPPLPPLPPLAPPAPRDPVTERVAEPVARAAPIKAAAKSRAKGKTTRAATGDNVRVPPPGPAPAPGGALAAPNPGLWYSASPAALPYTPQPVAVAASPAEARFIEPLYLALNPDVAEAVAQGAFASGLSHWQSHGRAEERAGMRPSGVSEALFQGAPRFPFDYLPETEAFDAETYFALYPDLRAPLRHEAAAARQHWLDHGRVEGRYGPGVAPFKRLRAGLGGMRLRPFGINIYGPFAATSGLGTAARGLLRAVMGSGIPFELHPFDVGRGAPRITRAALLRAQTTPPTYRVNLILANADQVTDLIRQYPAAMFEDAYNIAVWAWELAAFRPDWFTSFACLDEVWGNSDFEVRSIAAVSPVPVEKIRLPVEVTAADWAEGRAMFGIPADRFVFLLAFDVGSTSGRKNPLGVIRAFRDAFPRGENVFLVVKFLSNAAEPQVTRALNQALRGADNVLVVADRLPEEEMALLQAACDCLVSAHRSEGYGLNIAEFMALGKPVIATAYSGNLEFFDQTVGYPLDYALVEIDKQMGPYMPHYIWADPTPESIVAQLRAVYEDQAGAWARGARGAARIAAEFGTEHVGRDIRQRLTAIGLDAELPAFLGWYGRARPIRAPGPVDRLTPAARAELAALGDHPPRISLIVPVYNVPPAYLRECVDSVRAQTYPYWELCLCDDASTRADTIAALEEMRGQDPRIRIRTLPQNLGIGGASNAAVEISTGAYIGMLDNDDTLTPDALMEIARALVADPTIDVLYTDEDKIDENGALIDTYYKPDWSPEHLESVMYVLHMLTLRKKLFLDLGGFRADYAGAQDYDLMLRASRATQAIHHVPRALYHWRAIPGSSAAVVDAKPYALQAGMRALTEHATIKYEGAASVEDGLLAGTFRLRRHIPPNLRATLLVLTDNREIALPKRGKFAMVDNFVESIVARTDYCHYEIVVVDNGKLTPPQLARFAALGVRVELYRGSMAPFNYAHKANFALRVCRTENLVLLNDDMEVINADWLTALLELSQDPEIGGVGARLLHADGTLQHAGCVMGVMGSSTHVYHSFPGDFIGYNGFTHLIRNYAAVTAACFATRKSVMAQVGGFDESFATDYNDTDLCLRIVDAGYRIVYTPYAQLYHYEGATSKRSAADADETRRFVAKWRRYVDRDPYYNPNLPRDRFDYVIGTGG